MFRKIVFTLMIAVLLSTVASGSAFAGQEKVTVCHKPGTEDEATLTIAAPAAAAHLGHGDYSGPCRALQSAGCDALNAAVPDAKTDTYSYTFLVSNLAFYPGEVIHVDTTVTMEDIPNNISQMYALIFGANGYLDYDFAEPISGEQATISVDYIVVDGDSANAVGVDVVATEGFTLGAVHFSCTSN